MHFISAAALQTLSQLSLQSLSPDPDPAAPGFGLAVLNVISADPFDEKIRLAAAVHFKNHVRFRWTPSSSSDGPPPQPIPDAEKNQIKALIVSPMLKVPRRIRPQLSEALSIVSSHDFPLSWPSLLPELVSNLHSAANYSTVNGLLGAANSLLLKFRHSTDTSALCLDLKYCLDGFATPPP